MNHLAAHNRLRLITLAVCLAVASATAAQADMLFHIGAVTPRVGQRGTTVDVVVQGICLHDARELIFYRPGIKAISIEPMPRLEHPIGMAHGGRLIEQVRCRLEIAADCPLGEYPFRIRTGREVTSLATFQVSPFTVTDENEQGLNTNDTIQTALAVTPNVTVRGKMGSSGQGDVDVYRVPAVAGQELSVEVDSVRISDMHYGGSEHDLVVRILDETGKELAANDDNPLHLQDPLVSVKLPRSGVAYVEVQRSVFGPDDRAYCVHIGTNRRPLAAFPPGGPSGTVQRMRLLGDPLGEYQERISVPENPGTFEYFGEAPSPLLLRSSPYPNVLEDPGQALNHVEGLPAALNGVISKRGEVDTYQVAVKQGDRLRVRVFAASLGSPVDPRLRIRSVDGQGQSGAVELEADDASLPDRDIFGTSFRAGGGLKEILDPSVIWEPKNDGAYRIELEDMSGSAGPTAVYRIEVEPAGPAVHTLLTSTGFDWVECVRTSGLALPQGNRWTVNVNLPQGQGSAFRGELKLVASGLPEGVELVSTQVPAGRSVWPVQFVAGPNSVPGSALITLKAQPVNSSLEFQSQSQQNLPFLNHSGGDAWRTVRLDRYVLAVTDPAPFSIELEPPTAPLVRGGELALGVKLTRREGFHEPVEFQCDWVPPGVSVGPAAIIGPDETHAVLRLSGEPNAPVGPCPIVVTASSTRDDMDGYLGVGRVRVSSEFVKLTIAEPFVELVSQPESVRRGERKPYIWTVQRVGAFEGEATIRLVGLPKGVSVVEPLPTINSHSQQVAFQIEASEEALLGSVQGVTCEATIEAGGQQILQRTGRGTLRIDPKK